MDTNLSTLAYQRESTWGTAPASPALKKARITGENLMHEKDTAESAEIRDDRQKPDSALVGSGAGGQVKFELSWLMFQHWLEAALMGVLTVLNISITVSVSASTQIITGTAGDFTNVIVGGTVKIAGFATSANNGLKRVVAKATDGSTITLAAGSITTNESSESITIVGTLVRNGSTAYSYFMERKVPKTPSGYAYQRFLGMMVDKLSLDFKSKAIVTGNLSFVGSLGQVNDVSLMDATGVYASGTLTLTGLPLADEVTVIGSKTYVWKASVSTTANQVKIGASASASLDNLIAAINGEAGGGTTYGSLTVAHTQVVAAAGAGDTMTLTAVDIGAGGNSIATTETLTNGSFGAVTLTLGDTPDTYTAADGGEILNATSNVGTITRDAAAMSEKFKSFSIDIVNNLRGRDAIGELGNFSVGVGSFGLSGKMECYFRDNAMLADVIAHENTSLSYRVTDPDGNIMVVDIPRLVFSVGNASIDKLDSDVMVPLEWKAVRDPVTDATCVFSFIAA